MSLVGESADADVLWVQVGVRGVAKPMLIAAVYLPPRTVPSVCRADGDCYDQGCGHNHPLQGVRHVAATMPVMAAKGSILIVGDINADSIPVGPSNPSSPQQRLFAEQCVGMWGVPAMEQEAEPGEQHFPLGTPLRCLNRDHGSPPGNPTPTYVTHGPRGGRARAYDNAFSAVGAGDLVGTDLTIVDADGCGLDHRTVLVTLEFRLPPAAPSRGGDPAPGRRPPSTPDPVTSSMRSYTQGKLLGSVPLTSAEKLRLAARSVVWMRGQAPDMPQEVWNAGLYDLLNNEVAVMRGQAKGGSGAGVEAAVGESVAHLKAAMHAASRAHRAWVASCNHERHKPGFDGAAAVREEEGRLRAYRAAKRTLRRASRQAVAAEHGVVEVTYLDAIASNDPRAAHAAVRAAFPSDKEGAPHPLAHLATVMDVRAGATASDVLPLHERGGMSRVEIGREAAQRHADALTPVFTELGTDDPHLSSTYLLQRRQVLEAARCAREEELRCRVLGLPSQQGLWSAVVTEAEVEGVLQTCKLTPATLGTAMAVLVAAGVGAGEAHTEFREHLAHRLSQMLARGEPAQDDCLVVLTPLFKGGGANPADPLSYRDIAVVGALSKLLIQVIRGRLEASAGVMAAIDPLQAGFQRNRSTLEHVVMADLVRGQYARRGKQVATAFVDIRRAYPSVNHELLLAALWELGITGNVFEYLRQWLAGQHMYVRVDGQYSRRIKAGLGLPEGSCLSCLLFLIYFSYVMKRVNAVNHPDAGVPVVARFREGGNVNISIRIPSFADDASLWAATTPGQQALLNALADAFIDLRMRANVGPGKTAAFPVDPPPGQAPQPLTLPPQAVSGPTGDAPVPVTEATSYKLLGASMDARGPNVHASHHARMTATSHRAAHNMATSQVTTLPLLVAGRAYNSLVLQSITYGIGVWGAQAIPPALLRNERNMASMLTRSAVLPLAAAQAVAGVKSLTHERRRGLLSAVLMACTQGRAGVLRAVVCTDALDWLDEHDPTARQGVWFDSVLRVLQDVDDALQWNEVEEHCAHGTDPVSGRPPGVPREPYPTLGPRQWRRTVANTLLHWRPDTPLVAEAAEHTLILALQAHKAAALRVVSLRERTRSLWCLTSLVGVASLSCSVVAPPYASMRRTPGNQLRTLARGGLRCFLGWAVYDAWRQWAEASGPLHAGGGLGPGARAVAGHAEGVGDSLAYMPCPMCSTGAGCTLRHLVQECGAFRGVRDEGRTAAQLVMAHHDVRGALADLPHTDPALQDEWWLLTVGAQVAAGSWVLAPGRQLAREPGYVNVLGATGRLLHAVLGGMSTLAPQAAGSGGAGPTGSGAGNGGAGHGGWGNDSDGNAGEGGGSGSGSGSDSEADEASGGGGRTGGGESLAGGRGGGRQREPPPGPPEPSARCHKAPAQEDAGPGRLVARAVRAPAQGDGGTAGVQARQETWRLRAPGPPPPDRDNPRQRPRARPPQGAVTRRRKWRRKLVVPRARARTATGGSPGGGNAPLPTGTCGGKAQRHRDGTAHRSVVGSGWVH